mmetsp:Transcript_8828/g.21567  ORF Transcript_8828/g.21567 Transcript_8828/m.21567 type:complete len:409 (-) Transcript_8828:593-1819(-)
MRIAVQYTGIQQHCQVCVDSHPAEPGNIRARVQVQAGAVHPLGHQDLVPDQLPHDRRGADGVEVALDHGLLEVLGVLGFQTVVGLGNETPAPLVDEQDRRVDVVLLRRNSVGRVLKDGLDGRQKPQDVQIEGDLRQDPRALDLDGHVLARHGQLALVDLADGGRGDRIFRELAEDQRQVVDPELALEDFDPDLVVEGRHLVLKGPQLESVGLRDEVRPDRERLAEFDECRTELLAQVQGDLGPARLVSRQHLVLLVLEELSQNEPIEQDPGREGARQGGQLDHALEDHELSLRIEGVRLFRAVGVGARLERKILVVGKIYRAVENGQLKPGSQRKDRDGHRVPRIVDDDEGEVLVPFFVRQRGQRLRRDIGNRLDRVLGKGGHEVAEGGNGKELLDVRDIAYELASLR